MTKLAIAAAQMAALPGEVAGNVARHVHWAQVAASCGVRLLVFPELSLTGYELALARANPVVPDDARLEPLRRVAEAAGMTVVVGAPVPVGAALHIGALCLEPSGAVRVYAKQHVHESEAHVFAAGAGGELLRVGEAAVGLAICRDATFPAHAAAAFARGADLYAAGAMITGDAYARKTELLQGYAREHGRAVMLANYSGWTGGEESAGKSAIWAEGGELVVAGPASGECLVMAAGEPGRWRGEVVVD